MVHFKQCSYGTCSNDTRHAHKPHMQGVWFLPFPKPTNKPKECDRWIRACGRPAAFDRSRITKSTYVCSKHFVGGNGPTRDYPDPVPLPAPAPAITLQVMYSLRAGGDLGSVPAWLETQNLAKESLRAAVIGMGTEILALLCARADPAPVRVQLRYLSTRKFTDIMYADLCRYMDMICTQDSKQNLGPLSKLEDMDPERFSGVVRNKGEDSIDPELAGRNPRDGRRAEFIKKFRCSKCACAFVTEAGLQLHTKRHHPVFSDKKYKCNDCSYSTESKRSFLKHMWIHTGVKPYVCSMCGKGFSQSSSCQQHVCKHSQERPYTCSVCSKTFSFLSDFRRHARIHTGERPYACTVCAKRFTVLSNCRQHMRIHTGERPYVCTVCSKAFSDSSGLHRHTRIHTGECPYTCKDCGKTFTDLSNCHQHMRVHQLKRVYKCNVCGKAFRGSAYCKKHEASHV
uniref:Uncharacterized protein n=1 Tax=Eptatretus burgeri TaxID=7764 RepID=A0A8C4QH14_EPTBU